MTTDLANGSDGIWVMTHADKRRHLCVVYWDEDLKIRPVQAGWVVDDQDEVDFAVSRIMGDVPLNGWVALAQAFLERYDPTCSA